MDQFILNRSTIGATLNLHHYRYISPDGIRKSCLPRKPLSEMCRNETTLVCASTKKQSRASLPYCSVASNRVITTPGSWRPLKPHPDWSGEMWYEPEQCRLKYYTPEMTYKCLNSSWIVGWGESTMKQAMSNFLEDHLNKSVIPDVFMKDIDYLRQTLPKKKRAGLPNFFTYRQWDRDFRIDGGVRITMAWGGCKGWVSRSMGCPDVAMRNREYLETALNNVRAGESLPRMLTLSHHIWRAPYFDEFDFVAMLRDSIKWLHKYYDDAKQPRPLIIWNSATKMANDEKFNRCRLPADTFQQHLQWVAEDTIQDIARTCPNVVYVDRWAITHPFHFEEDGFVHTGVHYGSSIPMCMTGLAYKRMYDPLTCARNIYPERLITQIWLNLLCNE
eukprot:PhF_6_TR18953/c0_g1_i4/m.27803